MNYYPIWIGSVAAAVGAGWFGATLYQGRASHNPLSVQAECGFAASESIRDSTLRLRCGLEQAEIEAMFAAAFAEFGLDGKEAGGEPTRQQIEDAAKQLGLTVDAVKALVSGLLDRGGADPAPVDWAIDVAVVPASMTDSDGTSDVRGPLPVRFPPESLKVGKEESEAETQLLAGIRAKCGAAVGEQIAGSVIEIACGPGPDEVEKLIDDFVRRSGADSLQSALAGDRAARQELIDQLSASFGLEDGLVEALVANLEAADLSDSEAAGELDRAMRAQVQQALTLLKIGTTGDTLKARQGEIAQAVVSGDAPEAERLLQDTGEMLRPLADDLAPEVLPPLVAASRSAQEARDAAASDPVAAIRGYVAAMEQVRDTWPVVAEAYEMAAAELLANDRAGPAVRETFGGAGDPAVGIWLDIAQRQRGRALDLGLAAADRIVRQGKWAVDDALLQEAADVLVSVEPLIAREQDPKRYVALNTALASLQLENAQRSGDWETLRRAESAADAAIDAAEALGEEEVLSHLTTWASVQLYLGRWSGDPSYLDRALDAFERVAGSQDADQDLATWASAQNNVAVVQSDKAAMDRDTAALSQAAATYRRIAARMDQDKQPESWAHYTRNMASALNTLGGWEGFEAPIRESISALEELRAFEAEGEPDLASAYTIEKLAQAWWELGYQTKDPDAYATAAQLMGDAVEIYDPETAARQRVTAQLQLGDIRQAAAAMSSRADDYLAAADAYSAARSTAEASDQLQLYVRGTLAQATALDKAAALGGTPEGSPEPRDLVAAAKDAIDGRPTEENSAEWDRLATDVADFANKIGVGGR